MFDSNYFSKTVSKRVKKASYKGEKNIVYFI